MRDKQANNTHFRCGASNLSSIILIFKWRRNFTSNITACCKELADNPSYTISALQTSLIDLGDFQDKIVLLTKQGICWGLAIQLSHLFKWRKSIQQRLAEVEMLVTNGQKTLHQYVTTEQLGSNVLSHLD